MHSFLVNVFSGPLLFNEMGTSPKKNGRRFLFFTKISKEFLTEPDNMLYYDKIECHFWPLYTCLLYTSLLSLSRAPRNRPRAFLRSAAVTMPQLVARWLTPQAQKDLERQGYFVPDYAYVREMRITPAFLRDLWEYDLFSRYTPELASLFMVHGALDEVVPVKDARRFAETFGAQLRIFPQGEHPLMGNGELEAVLAWAADFFLGKE